MTDFGAILLSTTEVPHFVQVMSFAVPVILLAKFFRT
jgi:hypothetical protein